MPPAPPSTNKSATKHRAYRRTTWGAAMSKRLGKQQYTAAQMPSRMSDAFAARQRDEQSHEVPVGTSVFVFNCTSWVRGDVREKRFVGGQWWMLFELPHCRVRDQTKHVVVPASWVCRLDAPIPIGAACPTPARACETGFHVGTPATPRASPATNSC